MFLHILSAHSFHSCFLGYLLKVKCYNNPVIVVKRQTLLLTITVVQSTAFVLILLLFC